MVRTFSDFKEIKLSIFFIGCFKTHRMAGYRLPTQSIKVSLLL